MSKLLKLDTLTIVRHCVRRTLLQKGDYKQMAVPLASQYYYNFMDVGRQLAAGQHSQQQ